LLIPDILSSAIGTAFGFGARTAEQIVDRRRRRIAIATALLSELRSVELDARQLVELEKAALRGGEPVGGAFLRLRTSDDLLLFQPATVTHVLGLAALLATNRDLIAEFQAKKAGDWVHQYVRANAGFICQRIPKLKADLVGEEGELPPAEPFEVVYGMIYHSCPHWPSPNGPSRPRSNDPALATPCSAEAACLTKAPTSTSVV
jgi:hypothetical protein